MSEPRIGVEPRWMPLSHRVFDFLNNIQAWKLNRSSVRHQIKNCFMVTYNEAKDIHLRWEYEILPIQIMDAIIEIHKIKIGCPRPIKE